MENMHADVRVYSVQRPIIEDPVRIFSLQKQANWLKWGNTCGQIAINVLIEFEFHLVNIKV